MFIRVSLECKAQMNLQTNQIMDEGPSATQPRFTATQGQYLAFIYAYTCVLGRPPAESDLQQHFNVTAPAVHQMVLTLERNGLIKREPGIARSIQLLVPPEALPMLRQH
jgi:DNA-binding MarR family transcriptional regulator